MFAQFNKIDGTDTVLARERKDQKKEKKNDKHNLLRLYSGQQTT